MRPPQRGWCRCCGDAGSLSFGAPLLQATSLRAGAAGRPRLTGTRLPLLTRDTQDSAHACCEISYRKLVVSSRDQIRKTRDLTENW